MLHTVDRFTLKNGLRAVTIARPHLSRIHIAVFTGVGGWHERTGVRGVSHLLEHMLFRGNDVLPTQLAIDAKFDAIGAEANAFTGESCTAVVVTVPPENAAQAANVMVPMLRSPSFALLDTEREIVGQEAAALFDPKGRPIDADDRVIRMLFGAKLGMPATGMPADVARLNERKLRDHHAKHYVSGNMVVVCAGPLLPSAAKGVLEAFAVLPRGPAVKVPRAPVQRSRRVEIRDDLEPTPTLRFAFLAPGTGHHKEPAAHLLAILLDSGPMGRLWRRLRGDVGLVYTCGALHFSVGLDGMLLVRASGEENRLARITTEVFEALDELRRDPVSAEELQAAQHRVTRQMEQLDDHVSHLAHVYGTSELLNQSIDLHRWLNAIRATTRSEVRGIARRVFQPTRLNLLVAGTKRKATRIALTKLTTTWSRGR